MELQRHAELAFNMAAGMAQFLLAFLALEMNSERA
jgi:hypothetical protein